MKKLIVLLAALAMPGCSPAMYPMPRGAFGAPGYYRPLRETVEPVPRGRWDNVMRLPKGSTIDVLTVDGAANVGPIAGADIRTVRLFVGGTEVTIARLDVVRVDLVDVAGSDTAAVARKAARGALLGAGVVALVTGVIGREAWPPPGAALRGGAAIGAVSAAHDELARRGGRLIYLSAEQVVRLPPDGSR